MLRLTTRTAFSRLTLIRPSFMTARLMSTSVDGPERFFMIEYAYADDTYYKRCKFHRNFLLI